MKNEQNILKWFGISPLTSAKENNDFRPIALTSVAMKCFEHIAKERLLTCVKLDYFQFAYRPNRITKDACISLDYFILSHLEKPSAYAKVLFVDFSPVFNTIGAKHVAQTTF